MNSEEMLKEIEKNGMDYSVEDGGYINYQKSTEIVKKVIAQAQTDTINKIQEWVKINSNRVEEGRFVWTDNLLNYLEQIGGQDGEWTRK